MGKENDTDKKKTSETIMCNKYDEHLYLNISIRRYCMGTGMHLSVWKSLVIYITGITLGK